MKDKNKNYLKFFVVLIITASVSTYIAEVKENVKLASIVFAVLGFSLLFPFGFLKIRLLEPFKSKIRKIVEKFVEIYLSFPLQYFVIAGFGYAYAVLSQEWLAITAFYLLIAYLSFPVIMILILSFFNTPIYLSEKAKKSERPFRNFLNELTKELITLIIFLILIRAAAVTLMLLLDSNYGIVIKPGSSQDFSLVFAIIFTATGFQLLWKRWLKK